MAGLEIFVVGLLGLGGLLSLRIRTVGSWARELQVFRLLLPVGLTADEVARWLSMLAASTSVPQWAGRPPFVLGLEVRASARDGIAHFLLVPKYAELPLLQTVRAGLAGVRLEPVPEYGSEPRIRFGWELRLTSTRRPLAVEHAEPVAAAFLASLQPLTTGQELRVVWYLGGARTSRPVVTRTSHEGRSITSWFNTTTALNAEEARTQRAKDQEPQLLASIRISAAAKTSEQARAIVSRTAVTLRGMNAPGVHITYRWWLPGRFVVSRMARHALPLINWMLLNTRELSGLIGFPIGETYTQGLALGTSRQLPPTPTAPRSGLVLARSTYPGATELLRMDTSDRLRHTWLLGPTGTGKSTLIANMALQDAHAGHGFALIDPKSDLCDEILVRLPERRHDDVIVLDPTAYSRDTPIVGLNLLGHAHTEVERELVVDHIVHIMGAIWADSWGPRTSDVLRNSLLTLACTKAMDGTAFTLIEVAEVLTNPGLRRFVTTQPGVPESVRPFWHAYESYSEAQKLQVIGPSLNKLRALSTRSSLRLLLGQSGGLNVANVLNKGKILLVPLARGTIGMDTAALLGSLVISSLLSATFARAAIPAAKRRPAFLYLDEFQDVLRLPLDLADALAQARGLGVGFILANQYVGQLPETIKKAALGTVRSTVLFQLDYDDAKALERRFAPLTATDLTHLPAHEVAMRLCENNATGRPVTGLTLPLPEATADGAELARRSGTRYGFPRSDVEAAIQARTTRSEPTKRAAQPTAFGRRKRGSDQ
jgi:hypothetical protein